MTNLVSLGWDTYFKENLLTEDISSLVPARVVRENKNAYLVQTETMVCYAEVTGKLEYESGFSDRPKVGDWVVGTQESKNLFIIKKNLPRKNKISRKVAGSRIDEQILATNIDLIFIVIGLDNDFNINRLERYLALGKKSGATSVIVLNKIDICSELDQLRQRVTEHSQDQKIVMVSAKRGLGISEISELFKPNKTGVLIGSSGVGKSTIINSLIGKNEQTTKEIREDDSKGMHTTSFRQLFLLPNGGSLIDTPGMRELSLWENSDLLDTSFQDISNLASTCKFRNCSHTVEKGCAVQEAIMDNSLDKKRHGNYQKMQKEQAYLQSKINDQSKHDYKQKQKKLYKGYSEIIKDKNKYK
jgi:ribosome biogenesis GTPase / thiamine phosphate phosphatase